MKIHCAHDAMVPLDELMPHPKNRNKHPDEQIRRLADILEYQGFRYPIKVSRLSGFITSGHGRLEAAKRLGMTEVPVNYQEYESEEQEYADLVADNSIALWAEIDLAGINADLGDLGPDFNIDLLGLKDFVLEPADKREPGCDEDEVPEKVEPKTRLGDIYQLGSHRLMCGDSTSMDAVEKLMDGKKADMVFTDPPYGISIVKKTGTDGAGAGAKVGFVSPRNAPSPVAKAREYKDIIGDGTIDTAVDAFNLCVGLAIKTLIFWGANHYASALPNQPQWLVWDKKLEDGGLDKNNFSDCELAWTNADALSTRIYRHTWAGMLRKGDRKEELAVRVHPTQKPVGLCVDIINDFSENNQSIIDLFGGSGSTLIACEKTNRKCFMMEIDPHYCDVIVARWEKYTGQKAKLLTPSSDNTIIV